MFSRQVAMYLAKHVGGRSTTRIGRFYNGRDHSTVCYALKRVAALREDDPEVDGLVTSLAGQIQTASPKENCPLNAESWMPPGATFLDALADRLDTRIFDRAKELTPRAPSAVHDPARSGSASVGVDPNLSDVSAHRKELVSAWSAVTPL